MDKIKIKSKEYKIIKKNLDYMRDSGAISEDFYMSELERYEITKINIQQVIAFIGAVLFITGITLFASNYWDNIDELGKFMLGIIASIILVLISYVIKDSSPKMSRLLLCINMVVNIVNIICINDYYNILTSSACITFVICISVLPTIKYLENRFIFSLLLINFAGLSSHFTYSDTLILDTVIYIMLLIAIIYTERNTDKFKDFTLGKFIRTIAVYLFIYIQLSCNVFKEESYAVVVCLIIAIILNNIKLKEDTKIYNYIGLLAIGWFGYMLADEYMLCSLLNITSDLSELMIIVEYLFSLIYMIFFIYVASKGSYTGLVFATATIFKYVDLSAIVFLLLGVIFLVAAYLIEKVKKREANEHE